MAWFCVWHFVEDKDGTKYGKVDWLEGFSLASRIEDFR